MVALNTKTSSVTYARRTTISSMGFATSRTALIGRRIAAAFALLDLTS
jgi:hypothetical protein